jgi:proteasome lid subunit RPN8/RPN11
MRSADWSVLLDELRTRGQGRRESGAFLLADRDGDRRSVTGTVYLDDLDPNCLQGHIHFDGRAYSTLWDICANEKLVVIGDVHTHPGDGVRQSPTDEANPMIAQPGHVALIVPGFASGHVHPHQVGVHLYNGTGWSRWTGKDAARRLFVRGRV